MKGLAEELRGILEASKDGDLSLSEGELQPEKGTPCEEPGAPCLHLQEAAQFVADDLAEATGLDAEMLSAALTEAMKCDGECGAKFRTDGGDFKGGKGEAFKTCEQYAQKCCSGIKDPAAFCAYLGRRAGKI